MGSYDVIVVGIGGVGSAAASALQRRGARVLGLDAFPPGHDRGSSHGATRIIRLAYFEEPRYVPLLERAYAAWAELEARSGLHLYQETGLLQVGPAGGALLSGIERSAEAHGLAIERVEASELPRRFPGFRAAEGMSALFEKRAGFLHVEACVRAYAAEAERAGAVLRIGERVLGWSEDGGGVVVQTDAHRYRAARLVLAPGAWAGTLLAELPLRVQPVRKALFWYRAEAEPYGVEHGCPAFLFDTPGGIYYGFPRLDARGVKLAEHSGGQAVADPLAVDRALWPEDQVRIERFLGAHLPGVSGECAAHAVCLYELSPDEHFIVDRHPQHPQVCLAIGLSGHGFKMASVLGEILADLTLAGRTALPIDFLSLDPARRPAAVPR